MPSSDNYRCLDCGTIQEFFFDGPPPAIHTAECCVFAPSHPLEPEEFDGFKVSRFERVWGAPSIGRVQGAGGSPARS